MRIILRRMSVLLYPLDDRPAVSEPTYSFVDEYTLSKLSIS